MGHSRSQNPNVSGHNSKSSGINARQERKTTRSTGNAAGIERNQRLAGMGHKSTSHVTPEDDSNLE